MRPRLQYAATFRVVSLLFMCPHSLWSTHAIHSVMSTFLFPKVKATVTLPHGSRIVMKPDSYRTGEPMVEYVLAGGAVTFAIPRRSIECVQGNFLARQLNSSMTQDVTAIAGGNTIRVSLLESPVFEDPGVFSLILDFLNRRLDSGAATLRRADLIAQLDDAQWRVLNEMESFIFISRDLNPFWTGLTGQDFRANGRVFQSDFSSDFLGDVVFNVVVQPTRILVSGPRDFKLEVKTSAITCPSERPVSLLKDMFPGMEFPFPVDFKTTFFIPYTAIFCVIEGKPTVCEGLLDITNNSIRIEPIDARSFLWFHFNIRQVNHPDRNVVYALGDSFGYSDDSSDDDNDGCFMDSEEPR